MLENTVAGNCVLKGKNVAKDMGCSGSPGSEFSHKFVGRQKLVGGGFPCFSYKLFVNEVCSVKGFFPLLILCVEI